MLTSIDSALTQLATACSGAGWRSSIGTAQSYQEALEFLLANRPTQGDDQGSTLNYASLQAQLNAVSAWLNNRAQGRSRKLFASFQQGGIG